MQPLQTCHNYRLAKVLQHERQGGAGVGQGVCPMEDHKPDDNDDDNNFSVGEEENYYVYGCTVVALFFTHQTARSFSLYPLRP